MSEHGFVTDAAVALFRNVNLGHPGSPVRIDLEQAFLDAGARYASGVQSNGSVVFAGADPEGIVEEAGHRLGMGPNQVAMLLDRQRWQDMLDALPPFDLPADAYREAFTFFDPGLPLPALPPDPPRVRFQRSGPGWVQSHVWQEANGASGDPGSYLERVLGAPTTTRVRSTIDRITTRLAGVPQG